MNYPDGPMTNLVIREWLNGSLFPLSMNLAAVIGVFLWDSYIKSRQEHMPGWWKMRGVPTACALFWVFSLDAVRACSVWVILRITNNGQEVPEWIRDYTNTALIIAGAGLVITILRCTYIFTPPKWGHWFWTFSATSTLFFLIASHLLP